MKFFIDTANVEEIKKANDMGIICGVTTNPSLIAKEGRDFKEVIKEITSIVDGAISGEVKATTVTAEDMIKEAREIASIHPNMVVKIPMTVEGLKAVNVLSKEGIKTNADEINRLITSNLKDNWSLNRISKINLSLIKLAIYEMVYKELPYKVAINEVVELAKKYADESAPVFINGILASVVKEKKLDGETNEA